MQAEVPPLEELNFVREIAPRDWMLPKNRDAEWYDRRGYSALQIIGGLHLAVAGYQCVS
jgi:hypothetical protein